MLFAYLIDSLQQFSFHHFSDCTFTLLEKKVWIMVDLPESFSSFYQDKSSILTMVSLNILPMTLTQFRFVDKRLSFYALKTFTAQD